MRLHPSLHSAALAACLTLPLVAAARQAAAPAKVPLSAFVQEAQFSHPRLSPDGKHLAITVRMPQGDRLIPILTFYSLPDLKVVGQARFPVFQMPLSYNWVSNTRVTVEKGMELGSREKPVATGEILAMDLDGSKQEYLFGYDMFKSGSRGNRYGSDYAHGVVSHLPRVLNNHVFVTSNPWQDNSKHTYLYDIDSRTGIRKQLADVGEAGLRFSIGADDIARYAAGTNEQHETQLYRFKPDSGNFEKVDQKGALLRPVYIAPDNSEFIGYYSASGEPEKVIRENMATGARSIIYENPEAAIGLIMRSGRLTLPFGAITATGMPRTVYFNEADEGAKLHKLLAAQFPGNIVHFVDFSDDGNKVLFAVSSDRDPGTYYLFDKSTGKADPLFAAMADIEPEDMAPRRPFTFKARDGVVLHGFVTMPAHAAGTKVPFVLLPHGGPIGTHDEWYFDSDAQFLASRGYAVIQINFRGSGGRGMNFENAGYRQWGGKMMDDLVDGTKWVMSQGQVDPARGCVYGASFGAYASLTLAAREPAMFKCAVGYAGVYDLKRIYDEERVIKDRSVRNYWVDAIGEDDAELARYSPAKQAASIKVPVLLVHGGRDKRTPPIQAEVMRDALIKANNPPEWLFAPTEGHGFYDTKNATAFYEKLEAFLARNIGK